MGISLEGLLWDHNQTDGVIYRVFLVKSDWATYQTFSLFQSKEPTGTILHKYLSALAKFNFSSGDYSHHRISTYVKL